MLRLFLCALTVATGLLIVGAPATAQTIDTAAIETATGLKGSYNQAENVFKVSKPRDDVKISVDRWTMPPFMGDRSLSWAMIAGGALMLIGVVLHLAESHGHEHAHDALDHEHAHSHDDGHHDHVHDPMPMGAHSHHHHHEPATHAHAHVPDAHHLHDH